MSRYSSTLAIVLNKKNLRETDLLLTLLTPHQGKITVLAKGIRNIKSTRLGAVQLGNTIKANLYSRDDRLWLSEAVTISSFLQTPRSLTQLNLLFFFLEIINRLIADNQQIEGVFLVAQNLIGAIAANRLESYLSSELDLLRLLGFGLSPEINREFIHHRYQSCQRLIRQTFESIIEQPLHSPKLFR